MTDANGVATQFSYDPLGQLLSATTAPNVGRFWTYDHNRNRSSQSVGAPGRSTVTNYAYDDADQLLNTSTPAGISSQLLLGYKYDLKGNLLSRTDGLQLGTDQCRPGKFIT